jgi:hypothetical protein
MVVLEDRQSVELLKRGPMHNAFWSVSKAARTVAVALHTVTYYAVCTTLLCRPASNNSTLNWTRTFIITGDCIIKACFELQTGPHSHPHCCIVQQFRVSTDTKMRQGKISTRHEKRHARHSSEVEHPYLGIIWFW